MSLIIQKFGGSSLATPRKIKRIAKRIVDTKRRGDDVVVVVSAMGNTTDRFFSFARDISPDPPKRELDMLLTAGERISMSLLSMAIMDLGFDAISFTGSQVGILTDTQHTEARITEIRGDRLLKALKDGKIPIVAGFQGVSREKEVTTLGRGGSDTTAVALGVWLKADLCEIYTDVSGVYTEDPKTFKRARKIGEISYEEMLELSSLGAKVLHPRACALAAKYKLPLVIRSSSNKEEGTMIREGIRIEETFVRAITHQKGLVRFSLQSVKKQSRFFYQSVNRIAQEEIQILFFAHGVPHKDHFDLSFIIPEKDFDRTIGIIERIKGEIGAEGMEIQKDLASISLIGPGVGSDTEVISRAFNTLEGLRIHIDAFSTSEMKLTFFIEKRFLKKGVEGLLKGFDLKG